MRKSVIEAIEREKLIVIVRGVQKEKLLPLAQAMYKGGIRLLEVTFDARGQMRDEETADCIRLFCAHFGESMFIGAGTVLREEQVALTRQAGGRFIISPDADAAVIRKTGELDMVSMPGAMTPGEIRRAYDMGADFVKLFPCAQMGPAYVKAVRAPLSHIPLTAVGGIDETNMEAYLAAGVSGFGVGTNIVNKTLLEKEDYEGITALAGKYVEVIRKWQTT